MSDQFTIESATDPGAQGDELSRICEIFWQRFNEAAGQPNQTKVVAAVLARPELARVWKASEFVAEWCIRHPLGIHKLIESGQLDHPAEDTFWQRSLDQLMQQAEDEAALDRCLREFRQQQMVRIAWRDLAGAADLEETMSAVSRLAETCLQAALANHQQWLQQRFGTPRDGEGTGASLVALALGKLGGGELNYSSDIDLIFAYDLAGQTDGERCVDNQEFFIKLVRKIIGSLDRVDAGGFVFRTDLRLRPNGESGPVVLSFAAMEHYYQTHGRDWERYALVKARQVAGSTECGDALLEMLRPFIYRKYLDYSAFDSIRDMKQQIERQLGARDNLGNIKLGRGGIREIEFLVQNFQLIRGGRVANLQTPSLYRAFDALVELGLVSAEFQRQLLDAYRFLRNTEHRLQMVNDQQTQKLPTAEIEQVRLSHSMGFDGWPAFLTALDRHRDFVHQSFADVLDDPAEQKLNTQLADLVAVWQQHDGPEQAAAVLQRAGIDRAAESVGLLAQFRGGRLYRAFANVERDRLDRLMPLVLQELIDYPNQQRTLSAFISVVEGIGRRSVYLSLLIENPLALKQLLRLCAASPWISRQIGSNPVVLDELIQPIDRLQAAARPALEAALADRLAEEDKDDMEGQMNALREFKNARVLRIAAADVGGNGQIDQIHRGLSMLAEVLLGQVLGDALSTVEKKQGSPPGDVGIIAYGKFAGGELGYHSDLDIVVCFEPGAGVASTDAEYYFSRVGQKLIHLISTRTGAGVLFELDMRLRPSGRSGTLVTSLDSFEEYQQSSAWTWEHQALVRARMVAGSDALIERFEEIRGKILLAKRDPAAVKEEISAMRERMLQANSKSDETYFDLKLDRGGIVDIEFLLQYLVLVHAADHPQIIQPRSTSSLIETLGQCGLLSHDDADFLRGAYASYLRRSLDLKLMEQPLMIGRQELLAERRQVAQLWQTHFC